MFPKGGNIPVTKRMKKLCFLINAGASCYFASPPVRPPGLMVTIMHSSPARPPTFSPDPMPQSTAVSGLEQLRPRESTRTWEVDRNFVPLFNFSMCSIPLVAHLS